MQIITLPWRLEDTDLLTFAKNKNNRLLGEGRLQLKMCNDALKVVLEKTVKLNTQLFLISSSLTSVVVSPFVTTKNKKLTVIKSV